MFAAIAAAIAVDQEDDAWGIWARRRHRGNMRMLRDASDPFLLVEEYFRAHYRLTRHMALELIDELSANIPHSNHGSAIPLDLQILSVLRFFAEGPLQKGVANDVNHVMSQPSFSRCLDRVLDGFDAIKHNYIRFPQTRHGRIMIREGFRVRNRIPHILGIIDCFVITIQKPHENEEAFYHYRHGHSLIVQTVVDSQYNILNVRACPRSNTDKFTYKHSWMRRYMHALRKDQDIRAQEGKYYLLGDSGYNPSRVMLTPVNRAARGTPAADCNTEFVRTRVLVEQTFGIVTNMFRCISRSRKRQYTPLKVSKIITASVVLHNFRRRYNAPLYDDQDDDAGQVLRYPEYFANANEYQQGLAERNHIINTFY